MKEEDLAPNNEEAKERCIGNIEKNTQQYNLPKNINFQRINCHKNENIQQNNKKKIEYLAEKLLIITT